MKKTIYILSVLFCLQTKASFNVDWNSSGAMLDETTTASTPVPMGESLSANLLYALYFSPDVSTSMSPAGGGGTYVWDGQVAAQRENDVLVQVAEDNWDFSARSLEVTQDYDGNSILGNSSGYFYSVVFEYDDPSVIESDPNTWEFTVPDGTYGYITPSVLVANNATLPSTTLNVNDGGTWDGSGGVAAGSAVADTLFAIPEPSVLAMTAAAGMVLLSLRRKIRK